MNHDEAQAKALYRRTCEFFRFNDERVFPLLDPKEGEGSDKSAMRGTYLRAYYFLACLTRLDRPGHFQVIMSIYRSMFEIYLDQLHLLKDPASSELYHAFANIDKMKRAIKISGHFSKSCNPDLEDRFRHLLDMASDPRNIDGCEKSLRDTFGIITDIRRNGARDFPIHWSNVRHISKRAEISQATPAFFVIAYAEACWSVHGGNSAINHIDLDGAWKSFADGHEMSTNLMMHIAWQTIAAMGLGIAPEEIMAFGTHSCGITITIARV